MDGHVGDRPVAIRRLSMLAAGVLLAGAAALYLIGEDHPNRAQLLIGLTAWAVIVLALFGGLKLGAAGSGVGDIAMALVTMIAGVAAMLIPPPYRFAILAASFAAQGAWEAYGFGDSEVEAESMAFRLWRTIIAVAAVVLALVATAGQPG